MNMVLLDFLYPKKCLGCGKASKYFCDNCLKTVKLDNNVEIDGASLFEYQGIVRLAVQELKYRFLRNIDEELAKLVGEGLRLKLADRTQERFKRFLQLKPKVQPMPLFKSRQNWRGFNQAEIFARIVARQLKLEMADSLARVKKTRPQIELKRKERLENVKDIFQAKGDSLPKATLVIDDVWTTGATMREAIKTLRREGVKQVWGLTLAR